MEAEKLCKNLSAVIKKWAGKEIDIYGGNHGLEILSDFAHALGMEVTIIVQKEKLPKELWIDKVDDHYIVSETILHSVNGGEIKRYIRDDGESKTE